MVRLLFVTVRLLDLEREQRCDASDGFVTGIPDLSNQLLRPFHSFRTNCWCRRHRLVQCFHAIERCRIRPGLRRARPCLVDLHPLGCVYVVVIIYFHNLPFWQATVAILTRLYRCIGSIRKTFSLYLTILQAGSETRYWPHICRIRRGSSRYCANPPMTLATAPASIDNAAHCSPR